ncbi:MAG: TetR/AcrR family transcriptional regulator [Aeromicrobium sp.]|uniref:TetR/AcrR family transcriptional regulator n=1 Tax=Aeromicrobium sp. TaxID=1871063 RepID=UPI00261FB2C6|nr:TetR/AcrR family transcriptional regulator [Aeromicrobium sp.]MDF1705367.1 TetR/AcrR family transcriptional regulator [Aeromicrobium sp.]
MPKIVGDTLAAHRAQVRSQVFEAFIALMEERGYAAITLSDIAARAGVGRTALYNHFRDKEAVVVGLALHETTVYVTSARAALLGAASPTEALRTYVRHHIERQGDLHFGFGPEMLGLLSPTALAQMRDHVVEVEKVLVEILDAGLASGEFVFDDVRSTLALVNACVQPRRLDPETVADFVVRAVRA